MRPDRDTWAMQMASLTAQRSTCCRRNVGAVLLNERGHVLATGYNGVAAGQLHCNETVEKFEPYPSGPNQFHRRIQTFPNACSGAHSPSGTNLDGCQAIHAEQNALLQCRDVYAIHTCYVTASPCITCAKLLLNTSCHRIVFLENYPHSSAKELWESAGRIWQNLTIDDSSTSSLDG